MSFPAGSEPLFSRSEAERSCAYCGASFRLLLTRSPTADEAYDVACPECGKAYEVQAAVEPGVQLLAPRTDGKRDRYQETMF